MGELCKIVLEKDTYYPGDTVIGKVVCHFAEDTEIRAIRASARGRAKVFWKEGHSNVYRAEEVFFLKDSELAGEGNFKGGFYDYPFALQLPAPLPSSMSEELGNIKYSVLATIERPWTMNHECKEVFQVYSGNSSEELDDDLKGGADFSEEKRPFSLTGEAGPITIDVHLPTKVCTDDRPFKFSVRIKNNSNVNVERVVFTPMQGFEFHVKDFTKKVDVGVGNDVEVPGIAHGIENHFNLQMDYPDLFKGSLSGCGTIKVFWELRGEVHLPFPYNNFTVHVPFILAS